jgi:hypothetical protein
MIKFTRSLFPLPLKPFVEEKIVCAEKEARAVPFGMGYPIVLKGLVRDDTHKTESGMVTLQI